MNGRIVDGMRTVPIWTRYTYAWANELLSKAYGGNRIELSDIPELDARRRAYELERTFTLVKKSQNFLVQIFQAHLSAVIQQMLLTVVVAAMAYAPQFFLYKYVSF